MKKMLFVFSVLALIGNLETVNAQQTDEKIYSECVIKLNMMLKEDDPIFKDAVFMVENAYFGNTLDVDLFNENLKGLYNLSVAYSLTNKLNYKYADSEKVEKWASLFKIMTDTIKIIHNKDVKVHLPFRYDFEDVFGDKKWENMFVTKLLQSRKGNCHSLPYLYKILCDELEVPCHLALAPNHIYVKHQSKKVGWYNTELTSASFPIDAWLMASGYITLEAIQNGIYMDALDDKKCIALCLLDLAKGFDKKYSDNDGSFIIKCCDLTLQHFPDCVNALLFKAETKKRQFERLMKQRGINNPTMLRQQKDGKLLWEEMAGLYGKIHKLGYRTMPEKMYVDWLVSLNKEREKYSNKQVTNINKN